MLVCCVCVVCGRCMCVCCVGGVCVCCVSQFVSGVSVYAEGIVHFGLCTYCEATWCLCMHVRSLVSV